MPGPVYVAKRVHGTLREARWRSDGDVLAALSACLGADDAPRACTLEICVCLAPGVVSGSARLRTERDARGRDTLCLDRASDRRWIAPTRTIATNRSIAREVERYADSEKNRQVTAAHLATRSFLATRAGTGWHVTALYRGNTVAPERAVTTDLVTSLRDGLRTWLLTNQTHDGDLPYKYWPSRGERARSNNVLRQLLATVALFRQGLWAGDQEATDAGQRHLNAVLNATYRPVGRGHAIVQDGKAKLGASAIAGLALLDAPGVGRDGDALAGVRDAVLTCFRHDGRFRTFLLPDARTDQQNFYPGEALLFLVRYAGATGDGRLVERCLTSLRWYAHWHRRARNPAFVPWHTMAAAALHDLTAVRWLADWVFEMSDWLLAMQQSDHDLPADVRGRFYRPDRPDFGPPHAASTAVYLEGLAEAWRLAARCGEADRRARYSHALRLGLRALRQLQFVDETDMYYVSHRGRVAGALRTEVYDNTIRIDSVAHGLLAVLSIQRHGILETCRR
ncbi:hypothetical protein [Rhodovibrio sodomensis]|uniref:hypothetical protein n=1 Tax=Rhodovibrio sodomensis TaxID=1088 RepID=UPI0019057104|nr:hypothetical protein [Rhodovibrio sodomensis]